MIVEGGENDVAVVDQSIGVLRREVLIDRFDRQVGAGEAIEEFIADHLRQLFAYAGNKADGRR